MTVEEAYKLLMLASARDGRQVDKATAIVWADDLAGIAFGDAVEATKLHYQESGKWIMPSHIIGNVRRLRGKSKSDTRLMLAEIESARARSVPIPESLRAQLLGEADA